MRTIVGFDFIAAGLLALFVFLGARRGGMAAGTGLLALVAGYGGALWAASHLGSRVAQQLAVSDFLGPPIAGTLGFLVAFAVFSLLGAVLRGFDRDRLGDLPRTGLDRSVGGIFGALRGGLVVVLLSVLALWVDAARQLEVSEGLASLPPLGSSRVAQVSGVAVETIVRSALADAGPMAGVAARLVARPAETLKSAQQLVGHGGFEELHADALFWRYIQHGAIDNALNQASFYRLSQDDDLRQQLASLAIITPEEAADPRAFRAAIGQALVAAGPRIEALSQDRSLQRLAEDPEILGLLQAGDTFALITHPKIRALVERATTEL